MNNTILITGASSGIGKAAARYFAQQGWQVAATMRNPDKEQELRSVPNVRLYALDVTKPDSVNTAVAQVMADFGHLDVLVNNAGYGVDGVFEAMTDDVIERQFDTNVFGLMRMTRAVIPHFRERGRGTIIQIASMGGRITFPLFSIYHGTKWAVEGFSESLHYELQPLGIKVRIVEPGAIKTDFYDRNREFVRPTNTNAYDEIFAKAEKVSQDTGAKGESPEVVAKAIFKAAMDGGSQLRYPVGSPAPMLLRLRKLLPESVFFGIVRRSYKL